MRQDAPGETTGDNPKADARERECIPGSGDPVDLLTGQMFTTQVDVQLPGALPLVLQRTHFSEYRRGSHFGPSWASTLDQHIELSGSRVRFADDQGVRLVYPLPEVNGDPVLPDEGPRWPLRRDDDGIHLHQPRNGRTIHFPAPGRGQAIVPFSAITDRNGARIDVDRDAGVPVAVRHSGGYHVDVDSVNGLVTELRLRGAAGPVVLVRYRYDGAGNLVEIVNSSGSAHRFDYDPEGRVVRWVDRNGEWYRYSYDDQGRVVRTEGSGDALTGTWQYEAGTTHYTNSLGHTTTYHFNDAGQLVHEVDALGNETRREWDRYHRLLSRTDPLGRTTRYDYDAGGNTTAITRPDGSRSLAEYDARGLRTKVVDPDGATWGYEYDARGNLVTATDPVGARTRYRYDEHGNLSAVTDPAGATTTVAVGTAGLPLAATAPDGAVTRYVRDDFGRVSAVIDPVGGTTRFGWTVEGAPLWRTLPNGATERWHYDGEGNQFEHVSPTGAVTRTETTHFGMPARRFGPGGARLEFAYDAELRLTTVVDAHGAVWRYEYDAAGRLVSETDFNGRTATYTYDAAGQLVTFTNGAGETTRLAHDLLGNMVLRDAAGRLSRFEYDPMGRLTHAVNDDADVVFELDALGRTVAEVVDGQRLVSEFDPLGRRIRRVTPSGVKSTWSYDAAGRAAELRTAGRTMSFHHDALGRELERRIDTGAVLTQTWAPGNRLTTQTLAMAGDDTSPARLVQQRSYGYLPDGTLTEVDDLLAGPRRFGVDPAGRVTDVLAAGWTEHYSYDATGKVVRVSGPWDEAGGREHTGTLTRRAGNVHHRYDAQGRLVSRQRKRPSAKPDTWHYAWDADDRLVAVTTPDGTRWRYRYDALGRRVAKQRLDRTGAVAAETRFTWDGLVLVEQTAAGGLTTTWEFEPGGFRPLTQTERTPGARADQDRVDERFYAIVTDLVGTPTEMIDEAGRVAWHARATLWGRTAGDPDAPGHTPLRFPGQYHDAETGLHYNYRRYYDPTTGRYASADPLGLAAAPDPHSYVPNPTTWMDPLGLAGRKCESGGTETFYRGMSRAEYENQVRAQNSLFPLHGETFVTQDVAYIEQLAARHPGDYEVLVRFDMEPGTRAALLAAGARDRQVSKGIRKMGLANLPVLATGNGQVHIKAELGFLNFGLRRDSVGIFNDRLRGHEVIREFGS